MKLTKVLLSWIFVILLACFLLLGPAMLVCMVWVEGAVYGKIAATYFIIIFTFVYFNNIANWANNYKVW